MAHAVQSLRARYSSIAGIAVAAMAIANAVGEARAEPASFLMLEFPGEVMAQKQETPACPNGVCPGLGNAFYLPEQNAETVLTGGSVMFRNRKLDECANYFTFDGGQRSFATADSMQNFISNTMASFNLSGEYRTSRLTVKATTSVMTGSSSEITTAFSSKHLNVLIYSGSVEFKVDSGCYAEGNIDPAFLEAFEALAPIDVGKVSETAQWAPYDNFLKQRGSHIMVQQLVGSRFEQWISSTSEEKHIGQTLEIKACAEVEGVQSGGGWSLASCAAYSKEEKEKALRQSSFNSRIVSGGTDETRADLLKDTTKKTLNAFIDSAKVGNQAVRSTFQPVWRILMDIYNVKCAKSGAKSKDCANLQRAFNLQAAYEGWTAIGCPQENDGRGDVMQRMAVDSTSSLGINTYQCIASKTGCRKGDDCHLGGSGSSCYCYGQGCIEAGAAITGTPLVRNQVRTNQSGGYRDGVNNSCTYRIGVYCGCDTGWAGDPRERTLYRQSSSQW
jgi:hypothetical protein